MYSLIGAITLFLILVTFHEYGHYSVARYFKIKILKFSIGFGPDLLNWKKRDPIKRLSDEMINKKIWTIEKQHNLDAKVDKLIDDNWEKALQDDFPDRKSLLDNVYKDD